MSDRPKIRVLSIAHPAVRRDIGRRRYHFLAGQSDLDVHLLVPASWYEYGCWLSADTPDDPGVTVHIAPIWFPRAPLAGWYLHVYPGLAKLIRQIRPDVIHLWEEPWSFVALQATLLRGSARIVLEVDQNILKRLPAPFQQIRRFVLKRTAHILARSPDAEQVVRANGFSGPSSPIAYGVDQRIFRPTSQDPGPVPAGLRLGYVGRLVVEKGLDDALDALVTLPSTVTLTLMGEGAHEPALRARVKTLGLAHRVSFRGWGSAMDVAEFIRGQDIMLILTRTTANLKEQFGRAIIEAQSCSVPIIGSACGAIPDVIGPGGWIVPESDPDALANCIREILADPEDRTKRAAAGIMHVSNRYTFALLAEQLATCWRQAAGHEPQ